MDSKESDKLQDILSKMKKSHEDAIKSKSKSGITVTDKGGETKDAITYAKDQEVEEFAKDALEVRSETIGKYHKEIDRKGLTIPEHRHQKKKTPYWTDLKKRTEQASYVKHLTKEDILYEKDLERDQANYKRYGHIRDEELLKYIKETMVENAKRISNKKKAKSLFNFATLNSLQRGVSTVAEHAERVNFVMETHGLSFRIQPIQAQTAIHRMFLKNPGKGDVVRYLAKYLIVIPKDEQNDTMYGFLTDTMRVQTTDLQAGTYFRLPKDVPNYTEEMLLKDVPSLKTLDSEDTPILRIKKTKGQEKAEKEWTARIHKVDSQKWQRLTELTAEYTTYANLTKYQFMFCFLSTRPGQVLSASELATECSRFIQEHPNERKEQFKKVVSTECNGFHRMVRSSKNPASKLTFEKQKTMRSIEVGAIPELSLIDIKDQIVILKGGPPGWKLLKKLCEKNTALDCAVNPEKQCETTENENQEKTPIIEESEEKPLGKIQREEPDTITQEDSIIEDVVIEDSVPKQLKTDPDALNKIADALSHIASDGVEVNLNFSFGRFEPQKESRNGLQSIVSELKEVIKSNADTCNYIKQTNEGLLNLVTSVQEVTNKISELSSVLSSKKD